MNSSGPEKKETVTCSSCGKQHGIPSSRITTGVRFDCTACGVQLRVSRTSDGKVDVVKVVNPKESSPSQKRQQFAADEISSVAPSKNQGGANEVSDKETRSGQAGPNDDAMDKYLERFLARLIPELTNGLIKTLRTDTPIVPRKDAVLAIESVSRSIQDQTSQLQASLSGSLEKIKKTQDECTYSCNLAIERVTTEVEKSLSKLDVGSALKQSQSKLLKDIEETVRRDTRTALRKVKAGIKSIEGEETAFRLPSLRRKENGTATELTDAQLLEFGKLMAKSTLAPASVARLIDDLSVLQAREHLLEDLPAIFDFLDTEIKLCEKNSSDESDGDTRKVLERLKTRMTAWMGRNKLESFPKEGEPFDWQTQECIGTLDCGEAEAEDDDRVAVVDVKGYRFTDGEFPLRRARVIVYKKP